MALTDLPARPLVRLASLLLLVSACSDGASADLDGGPGEIPVPDDAGHLDGGSPEDGGGVTCVGSGDHDFVVDVAGYPQTFRVHVPPELEGPAPVVVQLHGAGSSGEEIDRITGLSSLADSEGFLVVSPDGAGDGFRTWNAGSSFGDTNHVAALGAVIDRTLALVDCEESPVGDPERVYVAGQSNGAMMAYRLACERSDLVRAIVSGAGFTANDHGSGGELFPCDLDRPVPVLQMNGGQDRCVPIDGREPAVPPADENVANWREGNGCEAEGSDTTDEVGVRRRRWSCSEGTAVEWITEETHGHAWAGSDPSIGMSAMACGAPSESFSATEELWRFFQEH